MTHFEDMGQVIRDHLDVRFGATQVDAVSSWERKSADDGVLKAPIDSFRQGIEFSADCVVSRSLTNTRLFTGKVLAANIVGETADLLLRTDMQELKEQKVTGLAVGAGTASLPLLRSLLNAAGITDDKISIDRDIRRIRGPWLVTQPLAGLRANPTKQAGHVTISSDVLLASTLAGLDISKKDHVRRLADSFASADSWASVRVHAGSLYEAEQLGLAEIRAAIAWLVALAKYSFSINPAGDVRNYSREDAVLTHIPWPTVVHVRSLSHADRWFRNTVQEPTDYVRQSLSNTLEVPMPSAERAQERNAFVSWKDASDALNERRLLRCVSFLFQALELYCARTRVPRLFNASELRRLEELKLDGLSNDQKRRVQEAIKDLNSVPLLARVRHAIDKDRVPIEAGEFEALARCRRIRNDLEHGAEASVSQIADLRAALAVLNRMLIYRAVRVGTPHRDRRH